MSIIDTLVTDRTEADLAELEALLDRSMSQWAEEELAWFDEDKSKGAYNCTDLNRVGNAISYISDLLNGYGYSVQVSPKTDWAIGDIPTPDQLQQYLACVSTIRAVLELLPTTPAVPADMEGLTAQEANDIEQILVDIDLVIARVVKAFSRSNAFTAWSGDAHPIPCAETDYGRTWAELDAMDTTWSNWQVATWYLLLYGNLNEKGAVT